MAKIDRAAEFIDVDCPPFVIPPSTLLRLGCFVLRDDAAADEYLEGHLEEARKLYLAGDTPDPFRGRWAKIQNGSLRTVNGVLRDLPEWQAWKQERAA
ncbi:MAG TPA: hypothetical protein VF389_11755 [Woeseiaceae bacterium]